MAMTTEVEADSYPEATVTMYQDAAVTTCSTTLARTMVFQVEARAGSLRAAACSRMVVMAITVEVEADGDSEVAATRYPTIAITMEDEVACDHDDTMTTLHPRTTGW